MNDELEEVIREATHKYFKEAGSADLTLAGYIAAAIRERWPCMAQQHQFYPTGSGFCFSCDAPKPGPTLANGFTAVVKGKKVEVGDVVKLNDDGTVSKADARGEDAEVIRMWRDDMYLTVNEPKRNAPFSARIQGDRSDK